MGFVRKIVLCFFVLSILSTVLCDDDEAPGAAPEGEEAGAPEAGAPEAGAHEAAPMEGAAEESHPAGAADSLPHQEAAPAPAEATKGAPKAGKPSGGPPGKKHGNKPGSKKGPPKGAGNKKPGHGAKKTKKEKE